MTEAAAALPVVPAYPFPVNHLGVVFTWNLTVIAYVLDDCMDNWILNFSYFLYSRAAYFEAKISMALQVCNAT